MWSDDPSLVGVRDRVLLLRSVPDLAALDEDDLALVAEEARIRRFRAGASLLEAHRPVDRVFVLVEGRVRFRRSGVPMPRLLAGTVGLLNLLAGDATGVDALAEQEVLALELPAEAVFRNMLESYAITRNTVRLLAREFLAHRGALPLVSAIVFPEPMAGPRTRPLTTVEKLLLLRATPLGTLASLEAAAELVAAMTEVHFAEGEPLWSVGDPPTFWLRLEAGEISCTAADGRSVRVGPGFLLGELDGWGDQPRSFAARAETPLVALRMEVAAHVAILEAHSETAAALTMFLARRLLETVCSAPDERPEG